MGFSDGAGNFNFAEIVGSGREMWRECSPSERRSKGEMVGVWQSCPRGFAGGFSRGSGLAAMIWSGAEYVCKAVAKWLLREWCGKLAHEQRNEMERNGAKRNEVE